jgi:predicted phage terminase large subunit-like protein
MARKPKDYPWETAAAERISLDAHLIAGFSETFLAAGFDKAKPTPAFHYDLWEWDCSAAELGVAVCPRGHAKTTGSTITCTLADVLFGAEDFEMLIGVNEKKAAQFLENITYILEDSAYRDLQEVFQVQVLKSNETELVGRVKGREFCVMARGAGQKVRGELWRQMRPGKIRVDDLEDDETVLNDLSRAKLKYWFMNAVLPAVSDEGQIRMVGTILHEDSLLNNFLHQSQLYEAELREKGEEPTWNGFYRRAHKSYSNFTELLWPEKFTEKKLRQIQKRYEQLRNKNGYSQEYLGIAIAEGNEFYVSEGFIPMEGKDFERSMTIYGAIDFAVSEKKDTDNTAFGIAGVNSDNIACVLEMHADLIDTLKAAEKWFEFDLLYKPEFWIVEAENIAKSILPFLTLMMHERNHFLPMKLVSPKNDKKMRARSWQARHAARGVRYNTAMPGGFEELKQEMQGFPRAKHDDRVDVLSMIGMELATMVPALTEEEQDEEDYDEMVATTGSTGRSETTGY